MTAMNVQTVRKLAFLLCIPMIAGGVAALAFSKRLANEAAENRTILASVDGSPAGENARPVDRERVHAAVMQADVVTFELLILSVVLLLAGVALLYWSGRRRKGKVSP